MLETTAAVAWRTCRRSRLRQGCIAHQYGRRWPGKGTGGASHRSDDWALRPVNKILCDERQFGRHEWVTTMCALRQTMERRKRMERTTRRRHPCQHISANPFADQGCSLPPPGPQASLSPFRCCYDSGKSENPGLDSRAVMGVPLSGLRRLPSGLVPTGRGSRRATRTRGAIAATARRMRRTRAGWLHLGSRSCRPAAEGLRTVKRRSCLKKHSKCSMRWSPVARFPLLSAIYEWRCSKLRLIIRWDFVEKRNRATSTLRIRAGIGS